MPCDRCGPGAISNGPDGYCCARAYAAARAAAVRADKLARGVHLRLVKIQQPDALNDGWAGAAGELLVAADLIRRGHVVFRAITAHAPFDLVSYRDGLLERVEVKTRPGVVDRTRFDVLAVVNGDTVEYFRPEREASNA